MASLSPGSSLNSRAWSTVGNSWIAITVVRLCPDDPLGSQRVLANAAGIRGTSYVINEYVAYQTSDGYSVLDINKMKERHKLIVLFEGTTPAAPLPAITCILPTGMRPATLPADWYGPRLWPKSTPSSTSTARIICIPTVMPKRSRGQQSIRGRSEILSLAPISRGRRNENGTSFPPPAGRKFVTRTKIIPESGTDR